MALRPAYALGEDRNSCMVSRWSHRASAAPGVRAGRGSQPDHKHVYMRDPSGLRPAYALGEDRNHALSNMPTPTVTAAPGVRAGRGSQHRRARRLQRPAHELRPAYALGEDRNTDSAPVTNVCTWLRPAYALGEDRNNASPVLSIPYMPAAPGVRAGRGSQPRGNRMSSSAPSGCARRTRWARIATRRPRNRPPRTSSCARRTRWARIATSPLVRLRSADRPAAPGVRAGRGSQPLLADGAVDEETGCARRTRWARIATGRTRTTGWCSRPLRPAYALGEDRNDPGLLGHDGVDGAAPGVRAGRGSQRARRPVPVGAPDRCARRTRWARIATPCWRSRKRSTTSLRPAYALGEDRNDGGVQRTFADLQAAPGVRAGRGSQHFGSPGMCVGVSD